MTLNDGFDRTVSTWLDEQAGRGAPGYLDEILARTARTRQRPAWSSPGRWLPMQTTFSGRLAPIPRLAWAIALLAMLALAIAALLAAGVGQRRLPHFGAAANGQIVFVDGGNLRVAAADGANPRTLTPLPNGAERLTFSPDGTRFAYRTTTGSVPSIVVAGADGSNPIVVASSSAVGSGDPFAWSPDGRRLAFTMVIVPDKIGTIDVVNADGSQLKQLIQGPAAEAADRFTPAWSPDGRWISFFSTEPTGYVALNVIHPDGTGAQRLATSPMNPEIVDASWSPDPAQSRVVYVAGGYVKMFDLATSKETTVGSGFWPTWSPDGERIAWWGDNSQAVSVADLLAGRAQPTTLFPSYGSGNCQDHPEAAGKSVCGPAQWSPDGLWVFAPDVVGKAILIARSDGSGHVRSIVLDHPLDIANGPGGLLAWQAIAP
jgi:Tol biopolymer transport system component